MTKKQLTLETSLAEIDKLIEKMEQDGLTLADSLEHFERGITLIKNCQKTLTDAEQKVNILIEKNKQETLVPFETDDEEEEDNDDNE